MMMSRVTRDSDNRGGMKFNLGDGVRLDSSTRLKD